MTELEKLKAGLEYCYDDPEVDGLKQRAIVWCKEYNAIDDTDYESQYAYLKRMLGSVGEKVWIAKTSIGVSGWLTVEMSVPGPIITLSPIHTSRMSRMVRL